MSPPIDLQMDARLSSLLDGELDPAEAAALRAEVAASPALRARLDELAGVDAALRGLPARPVPGDLHARLRERIAAEAGGTAAEDAGGVRVAHGAGRSRGAAEAAPGRRAPARPGRMRRLAPVLAAAAAALVAVAVVPRLVGRGGPEPGPTALAERRAEPGPTALAERRAEPGPTALAERRAEPGPTLAERAVEPEVTVPERRAPVAPDEPVSPAVEALVEELAAPEPLEPAARPAPVVVAEAEERDRAVIEVLVWLEALDELEAPERG